VQGALSSCLRPGAAPRAQAEGEEGRAIAREERGREEGAQQLRLQPLSPQLLSPHRDFHAESWEVSDSWGVGMILLWEVHQGVSLICESRPFGYPSFINQRKK